MNPNPNKETPEQEQLRSFINSLEDIKSAISHITLPDYLTSQEKQEWQLLMGTEENDFRNIIDKAAIELDREEWYE